MGIRFGIQRFQLMLIAVCFALAAGCAPKTRDLGEVEEAYRLMDAGDNAKAVLVLERHLDSYPDDDEARGMLGSAYVGMAGIDIYRIQDTFQDVLFRRSLKDQFRGGSGDDPAATPTPAPSSEPQKKGSDAETDLSSRAEESAKRLDHTIVDIQKAVIYLARFPQIEKEKWILLDSALRELEQVRPSADAAVYRLLVRAVYLKSYLMETFLRSEDFGTRAWMCNFDLLELRDDLEFARDLLEGMRKDLDSAVNLGAKRLSKGQGTVIGAISAMNLADGILAAEERRSVQGIDRALRRKLGCETIP